MAPVLNDFITWQGYRQLKKFREPHVKGLETPKFWMLKAFPTVIWLQIIWRSC